MKLHKQLMNVKEYIQDVVSSIAAEAREKGITIDFQWGFNNHNEANGNDDGSHASNISPRKGSLHSSRRLVVSTRLTGALPMLGGMGAKNRSMRSLGSMISQSHLKKSGNNNNNDAYKYCFSKCFELS